MDILKVLSCQERNGSVVIRLKNTEKSHVIELIYLLCSLYEKSYIIRPSVASLEDDSKYLVCHSPQNISFDVFDDSLALLESPIPCHFTNMMEEINVTISQQILQFKLKLVYFLINKNEEKMAKIKNKNIFKNRPK